MELIEKPIHEVRELLDAKSVSSVEITEAFLERITAHGSALGAYLHVDREGALEQAKRSDDRCAAGGTLSVLDGIPMGLKDIFLTEGLPTTCSSKILEGFVPPYDGTAVRRLKESGAVILGKLAMDEFAMGGSNEWCAYSTVRNPWDRERVPGGSSGGSAVAVSAGLANAALGTDTGGSIRQPAAFTGIVGMKPTYGRVSRFGVIAFASSLDQVGPMTRDVTDCAHLLGRIAGHDPFDSTSVDTPVPDYTAELEGGVKGLKIGIASEFFGEGLDDEVRAAVDSAVEAYKKLGAEIVEVSVPHMEYGIAVYYLICTSEASSNLARYDGVRYGQRVDPGEGLLEMYMESRGKGFGPEVKRRIMLGTYALSAGYYDAYYLKAQKVRTLLRQDFAAAFDAVDVILTPTTPTTAFRRGENTDDPIQMYLSDIYTATANLAGLPGISLPCGFDGSGLPIGLQLLGPAWSEGMLLRAARAFEREHEFHRRRPSL
ncbi:MAG: Asp-tRNA(Asn)/Glu-tRNA(Gln) amidotransferase subunit GatA [Myxococcota bacterium]